MWCVRVGTQCMVHTNGCTMYVVYMSGYTTDVSFYGSIEAD